jgi:hypothetical protein
MTIKLYFSSINTLKINICSLLMLSVSWLSVHIVSCAVEAATRYLQPDHLSTSFKQGAFNVHSRSHCQSSYLHSASGQLILHFSESC